MNPTRRSILVLGASFAVTRFAFAESPHLGVDDPAAKAVGYVEDATQVDKARYPKFVAGQNCAGCSLYQGKATDPWGACLLFANKQVAGAGWCTSYGTL